jgi:hypothetical protein
MGTLHPVCLYHQCLDKANQFTTKHNSYNNSIDIIKEGNVGHAV